MQKSEYDMTAVAMKLERNRTASDFIQPSIRSAPSHLILSLPLTVVTMQGVQYSAGSSAYNET